MTMVMKLLGEKELSALVSKQTGQELEVRRSLLSSGGYYIYDPKLKDQVAHIYKTAAECIGSISIIMVEEPDTIGKDN